FRDLGALPPDTDLDDVIAELHLDEQVVDPTTMSQEQLVSELQRVIKALLGMGARLPKILMLYVKNLVFLDGAMASLAPDLDLVAEIANLSTYLAVTHGERLAAEIGGSAMDFQIDAETISRNTGIDLSDGASLTYNDLRERRDIIRQRLERRSS
ncbi:MAG: AarF/ABC1/UbiB kinase family protein, partial [Microthrixaceae bacterium]